LRKIKLHTVIVCYKLYFMAGCQPPPHVLRCK